LDLYVFMKYKTFEISKVYFEGLSGSDDKVFAGFIPAQSSIFLGGVPHGTILGPLTFSIVNVMIEKSLFLNKPLS